MPLLFLLDLLQLVSNWYSIRHGLQHLMVDRVVFSPILSYIYSYSLHTIERVSRYGASEGIKLCEQPRLGSRIGERSAYRAVIVI